MPTTACATAPSGRLLAVATPDCVAVYGDYERIDARGEIVGHRSWLQGRRKPSGDILRALLAGNFIVNGGVMLIRVEAFGRIGGFDERLAIARTGRPSAGSRPLARSAISIPSCSTIAFMPRAR